MELPGHGDARAYWLTVTKLQPPRPRHDTVFRQRLLDQLHHAVASHPITLVSAPAGYGKTTLLGALPSLLSGLSVAWLSLDPDDNEATRFLAVLIAALQRLNPACGTTAQALLASLPNSGAEARRIAGVLVNDILETLPAPFVLILEDLHLVVDPAIYSALDYLLERLPSQAHLVVSSRHDPPLALARLRARGQLAELRLPDLRFNLEETTAFLNHQLRLELSSKDLASLHARTEGWAAGLRLLANSLEHISTPSERSAFIARLAHTDRYVFDFLADEVLDRQTPTVRAFLLETSILAELTPALCQAVTGRENAPAILEDIFRHSLFLVAVDDRGLTYRYHHLFAEFLRQRLAHELPERVAELHRRAAETEADADSPSTGRIGAPARAVSHFLAAGLWERAAETMERLGEQLRREGLLATLHGWIEALPASVRDRHPRLLYLLGACALQRGALEEASSLLESARRGFETAGDEAGQGLCLLELVSVASSQFDYDHQTALVQQALAYPLPPHGRVQVLMARAFQSEYQGNWDQVERDVDQAIQITLDSGDLGAFNVLASILRLDFTLLPGGPDRLERYCRQVLARFGKGVGLVQAGAHSLLGFIQFLRGRLDEAIQEAGRARAIIQRLGGFVYLECEMAFVLGFTSAIRGDYAAAGRCWEELLLWSQQTTAASFFTVPILYLLGRTQWLQGNLDKARQTEERLRAIVNPQELPEATLTRALMRALLDISDGRYADAERTLRPAIAIEQKMRHCIIFGSARLLLAYLYRQSGRPRAALAELDPVLAACEQNGSPGWILKEGATVVAPLLRLAIERGVHPAFSANLLDLMGAEHRVTPLPDTGESLTPREIQVLRLIAAGASNRDIARQLVISEHTVKAHITNILGKLHASSRGEAAARARDFRLV